VLAASGDEAAALAILEAGSNAYSAAYAIARGDIHLASGRQQSALDAYREARAAMLALGNPPGILDTKITSLESRLASAENAS
jgi:predicted negative regulator of RcsB-dependent stress response